MSSRPDRGGTPLLDSLHVALELEIPSDVRYIERVVEVVTHQVSRLAYHPRQVTLNLPVALTEALSNAILRGNADVTQRCVRIHCDVNRERVILEVVDDEKYLISARSLLVPNPKVEPSKSEKYERP